MYPGTLAQNNRNLLHREPTKPTAKLVAIKTEANLTFHLRHHHRFPVLVPTQESIHRMIQRKVKAIVQTVVSKHVVLVSC